MNVSPDGGIGVVYSSGAGPGAGPGGGWSSEAPHWAGGCCGEDHGGGNGSPEWPGMPPPCGSRAVASSRLTGALQRVQRGNAGLVSLPQFGHRMEAPYPVTYKR
ncbi:hypothetical protein [Actinomadura sp. 7K534]|uniref:hypothetical protein n=1 Tax=Actinomadura sp. 7K534 TaxID=2530366 RepID=UPI00104DECB0|nr:hypothetical protein [Actinomadura sp. 7K534]